MINEKNTAIITYIDENYEENLDRDFLFTLRNIASYKGKVIVIDYGLSESKKAQLIKKYKIDIFSFDKTLAVFSLRYQHIPVVIESLPSSITNIMLVDGGDVWFQDSIASVFEETKSKIGCVEETIVFGSDVWTRDCLNILDDDIKEEILMYTNGKHVKNSGMVCGSRPIVLDIIHKIHKDIQACGFEYFGIDQLFFNYEFCKLDKNITTVLSEENNYVLVTHKDQYVIKNDVIYNKSSELIKIVHNAGGNWRMIDKNYKKDIQNSDLYYIENIRKIDCP